MALWARIPYLDQTLSFLGSALKSLCFILLSWPDQLVNSSCNLNRILIVQQLLCSLVQSAIIVELIRFSGYFSFKRIPFKLSHSSANRSGEDERQWALFNIVIRGETSLHACLQRLDTMQISL